MPALLRPGHRDRSSKPEVATAARSRAVPRHGCRSGNCCRHSNGFVSANRACVELKKVEHMSMQPASEGPSSVTETLAEVLARGRQLEALYPGDLSGVRLRQVAQIHRARLDFERFKRMLAFEIRNLQDSLNEALSIATEARDRSSRAGQDQFQLLAATTKAKHRWRAGSKQSAEDWGHLDLASGRDASIRANVERPTQR